MSLTTITTEKTSTTGEKEEKLGSRGPSSGLYFCKADLYSGVWTRELLAEVFPAINRRLIMLTPQRPRGRTSSRETRLYWAVAMQPERCLKRFVVMVHGIMWTWTQTNKTLSIERDCSNDQTVTSRWSDNTISRKTFFCAFHNGYKSIIDHDTTL